MRPKQHLKPKASLMAPISSKGINADKLDQAELTRWYWIIHSAMNDTLKTPHHLTVGDALDVLDIITSKAELGSALHYNASMLMQRLIKQGK